MLMESGVKHGIQIHSNAHKRSKSYSINRNTEDNLETPRSNNQTKLIAEKPAAGEQLADDNVQNTLKHEIEQLEKRLQDQLTMRSALEKALGCSSSAISSSNGSSMPKTTNNLIREIAILELEVMHLEQYLLSLYRKAFDQQTSTHSPPATERRLKKLVHSQSELLHRPAKPSMPSKRWTASSVSEECEARWKEKLIGPGAHRSQSSLSCRAVDSSRISPSEESLARALHSFHSQPMTFLEEEQNAHSGMLSLAEYLGSPITDHVVETPNKLSEDMIRCMVAIYCKLADPPLAYHGLSPSPASSFSSMSALSPQYLGDIWSPSYKRESKLDSRLINPFQVEGLKEFSGPYNTMVEIPLISRDNHRLRDVQELLQNYELILYQLDKVDPRKLKNDERLAFWINICNAIVMHAYIQYGIPEGNVKKNSLLIKAMCSVSGRSVNAVMIQGYILRCKTQSTAQWLRTLLNPRMKLLKAGDQWRNYAIEQPEPLLHFALCSGSHSDPAVRSYSSSRLFQQLESAKEEYIRATVGIWKEQKIHLPKVIDSYAKETNLSSQRLVDMIQHYLPENLKRAMQRCKNGKFKKIIEWQPHNFTFRYLLSRELAFPQLN